MMLQPLGQEFWHFSRCPGLRFVVKDHTDQFPHFILKGLYFFRRHLTNDLSGIPVHDSNDDLITLVAIDGILETYIQAIQLALYLPHNLFQFCRANRGASARGLSNLR